jgi:hypothetical protein
MNVWLCRLFLITCVGFSIGCLRISCPVYTKVSIINGTSEELLVRSSYQTDGEFYNIKPNAEVIFDGMYNVQVKTNGSIVCYGLFSDVPDSFFSPKGQNVINKNGCYYFVIGEDGLVYSRMISLSNLKPVPVNDWDKIVETQPDGYPLRGERVVP